MQNYLNVTDGCYIVLYLNQARNIDIFELKSINKTNG